ncbi:MAG TPA: glycosyl hydrolase, partial [Chitinophagaceae bacterium]|nr:glycosyl hydrolase [Chitinophagaceae bacterium]
MRLYLIIITLALCSSLHSQQIISTQKVNGINISTAAICIDAENDFTLVHLAAGFLADDIQKVTGKAARVAPMIPTDTKQIILIGSVERSSFIKDLIARKKISDSIRNKWEAYHVQVVQQPFPGVEQALVIMGSDRRGTAYGVFELSQQMGVSPWYWWADVPVKQHKELYVKANAFMTAAPAVKYRGIFINDEAPALS